MLISAFLAELCNGGAEKLTNEVNEGSNENHAVKAVEYSSMTREKITEILYAEFALDDGCREVTQHSEYRCRHTNKDNDRIVHTDVIKYKEIEDNACYSHYNSDGYDTADKAFNCLLRADLRAKLVLSEEGSDEVCTRIPEPRREKKEQNEENTLSAVVGIARIHEQNYTAERCRYHQSGCSAHRKMLEFDALMLCEHDTEECRDKHEKCRRYQPELAEDNYKRNCSSIDQAKRSQQLVLSAINSTDEFPDGNSAEKCCHDSPEPYTINDDEAHTNKNGDKSCYYSFYHNGPLRLKCRRICGCAKKTVPAQIEGLF